MDMALYASRILNLPRLLSRVPRTMILFKLLLSLLRIRETSKKYLIMFTSKISLPNGMKQTWKDYLNLMVKYHQSSLWEMRPVHLVSYAMTKIRRVDKVLTNVHKELSKNSMKNPFLKTLSFMSKLLSQKLIEKLRSKRKCLDIRTLKRDATCMLRISLLIPLKTNFKNYLVLMVTLNPSNFSKKKEKPFMLLSALNHQRKLQKPKLNFIRNPSMENNCTSTIMKLKK